MNKKTKLAIRMVKVPEYNDKIAIATTDIRFLSSNINNKELIQSFEKKYNEIITKCKALISSLSKNHDNKKKLNIHWRVGDLIYKLLLYARNKNLELINYERSIGRDIDVTPSKIYYLLHFRLQHEKISGINTSIPWSWYCELTKIKQKDKLREIENEIAEGKIRTKKELVNLNLINKLSKFFHQLLLPLT